MYLIHDFSVSQFIPKSPSTQKVRNTAANILKESRIFAKKQKINLVEHDSSHIIPKIVTSRDPSILGYTNKKVARKMSSIGITPLSEAKVSYQDSLRNPLATPSSSLLAKEKSRGYQAQALDIPIKQMGKFTDKSGRQDSIFGNLNFTNVERKKVLDEISNTRLIKSAKKYPNEAKENNVESLAKLKMSKSRKLGLKASDTFNNKISKYMLSSDGYDILQARDAIKKEADRFSIQKGYDIPRLPGKYK